ncbi:theronine dehydrogenase [Pseudarthrobacter sp. AG30]|uniref:glucose 1-dehydrogenase n=1 Tax=Pseudarthrobacter sp. AG30 TaxID=2249742 RepID=UPI000D64C654|nr:glucose 1-dehydrogenase [Pseudarthrobacter sp. AG30]RAX17056.1 theronine dehydrogenase [Pseudarthrobacter sp. AG30]
MKALTVIPGSVDSMELREIAEPATAEGSVLVETLAIGLCGTDIEITAGEYGEAPEGSPYLVLGHENLGRVLEAPEGSGLSAGDLVVGIVRRPDPVPCPACAAGQWDMCRNGRYTEHGIKGLHGFARDRYRADPHALVRLSGSLEDVGVLLEPTTIVAKAWQHIDAIGSRAFFEPKTAVVTGAGPVGLLAALLGVQRGLEVHVFDRVTTGPKPELVADLGAIYHSESLATSGVEADVLVECTGVASVVMETLTCRAVDSVTCLTGVSSPGKTNSVDVGSVNRTLVLGNESVFGSVNANRSHYEAAVEALEKADQGWLQRLISRRVPLADFDDAFRRRDDDVKVVLDFQDL